MASYLHPGVYIEEVPGNPPVVSASTSTPGFIGVTRKGPINKATLVSSMSEFISRFGSYDSARSELAYGVEGFFLNGGRSCYIVRLATYSDITDLTTQSGLAASKNLSDGSASTLKISAASVGLWGNDLAITVAVNRKMSSQGAGSDIHTNVSIGDSSAVLKHTGSGVKSGDVIYFSEGGDAEGLTVLSVTTSVLGGDVVSTVAFTTAFVAAYTAAGGICQTSEFDIRVFDKGVLQESWEQLSMLDAADNYVETVINDTATGSLIIQATDLDSGTGAGIDSPSAVVESALDTVTGTTELGGGLTATSTIGSAVTKTGFYAMDDVDDASLLAAPGQTDVTVHQGGITYCESRMDMFYAFGPPAGYSKAAIKTWRETTGSWDTKYAAMYWPRIKVTDPVGTGGTPRQTIDPIGHIFGLYARVDNLAPPDGGVWATPAGYGDFGQLKGVTSLEYQPTETDQDSLNPIGVNCIRTFKGRGVCVFGGRTLSADGDWKYINVRRLFIYVEKSIMASTKADLFRNNNDTLWSKLSTKITSFLRRTWLDGGLKGTSADEAFFVTIDSTTTTAADIAAGRVIGEIGLSANRPAEFIVFRFSQYDGGSAVTE